MNDRHHEPTPLFSVLGKVRSSTLRCFVSLALLGSGLSSCVPAKSYDTARTAAETEFDAHRRTRSRLEAAHQRIRALEGTIAERQRALENRESSVAEAKLATTVATKDKEAAVQLVEQLRSELARTGNHLLVFSDEKRELARALTLAEERVRNIEAAEKNLDKLVAIARDATLSLGAALGENGIEIGAEEGQVVLSIPANELFVPASDAIVVDAAPLLAAVGTVCSAHETVAVVVREPGGAPFAEARSASLALALRERGVSETRLVLPSRTPRAEQPAPAPGDTEGAPSERAPADGSSGAAPAVDESRLRYEIAFAI